MNKAYSRINWVNDPDHTTPLNATNLNSMDSALDTIDDRVVALDSGKSTVTMTPALQSGTKVADYSIDGVEGSLYAPTGGGASALTDLTDTAISSPSNGQVLKYNTSTSKWENANESGGGGGSSSLSGLSDVALTTLSDGQFLAYDSATSKWKNVTGGGGAVDSVNGKTGDVVLAASDVGALADDTPIPSDLSDLSDVDTSGVTDGQILKYNGTSGKFEPSNESGGTSDYTQLTNKPSINGVTLSGNKTSADLSIFAPTITSPSSGQVLKFDGTNWVNGSASGGSNPNLLDNAWFTVNQKGFTSKTMTSALANDRIMDRWKVTWFGDLQSQIALNLDNTISLKINKNSSYGSGNREIRLGQQVDNYDELIGKVCTFSVMLDNGTIYSITQKIPSTGQYEFQFDIGTGKRLYLLYDNRQSGMYNKIVYIRYMITSDIYTSADEYETLTIKAMKLELGEQSTLALDVAPNYTEELLKCQRYYYPLSGKSYNSMVSAMQQTRQFMTITLPTEMRAVPTFNGSLTTEGISGSTRVDDTVTSSNITVTNKQDIEFNFTTSNNFNLCSSARVSFLSGSYLSAEL